MDVMDKDINDFLMKKGVEYPQEMKDLHQVGNWLHFNYKGEDIKVSLEEYGKFVLNRHKNN